MPSKGQQQHTQMVRGKTPRNPQTSPRTNRSRIQRKQLMAEAVKLRMAGAAYPAIADQLGVSTATARKYVVQAMEETIQEPTAELRKFHLERLHQMLMVMYPKAMSGEAWAVDRVLATLDRISRLAGIDAPAKSEHVEDVTVRGVLEIGGGKEEYMEALSKVRQNMIKEMNSLAPGSQN